MPMYEYACASCGHDFEELVFGDEQPVCPNCESADAERKISMFTSPAGAIGIDHDAIPMPPGFGTPGGAGPCGTCGDPAGPGACADD